MTPLVAVLSLGVSPAYWEASCNVTVKGNGVRSAECVAVMFQK